MGSVSTSQLMEQFSVSIETVRRDLLILEQSGKLQRVHGGAVAAGGMVTFQELNRRKQENVSLKQELCRVAARFVQNGDTIGIDSGSTAVEFAAALKEHLTDLIIVTYSLDVCNLLCQHQNFHVILCGGDFEPAENCFVGPLAMQALSQLHVQKSFIFPTAVSLQHGICDHEPQILPLQQALARAGSSVYILADSSKFEHTDLLKQDDMRTDYIYVTDSSLPAGLKSMYEENLYQIITDADANSILSQEASQRS